MKLSIAFIAGCLCGGFIACQAVDALNAYAADRPPVAYWQEPPEVANVRRVMASMPLNILVPAVETDEVADLINGLGE